MNVGTKSLLFGVHQFLWHPITVLIAWIELYGFPEWRELVCIVIHDWGYWGSPNMDGEEGEEHPRWAAKWAHFNLDEFKGSFVPHNVDNFFKYYNLCVYHSRHYAKRVGVEPSKLCWADKLSIKYDPWWFYLTRAWMSGELFEYRKLHAGMGEDFKTHKEWYDWASGRAIEMGMHMDSNGISFHPPPEER